jgi:hypothetical protein
MRVRFDGRTQWLILLLPLVSGLLGVWCYLHLSSFSKGRISRDDVITPTVRHAVTSQPLNDNG